MSGGDSEVQKREKTSFRAVSVKKRYCPATFPLYTGSAKFARSAWRVKWNLTETAIWGNTDLDVRGEDSGNIKAMMLRGHEAKRVASKSSKRSARWQILGL